MAPRGKPARDTVADLLAAYRPPPGVSDELLDGAGRIRPVWRGFIAHFAALTPPERASRMARGDQYLRDAGVYFRQYGTSGSDLRAWPLSHIPVLLEEADWQRIAAGLAQRADLLEAVVADLYGENLLVAGGDLPASLIASSREWLRPMVGIRPRSGHFLHFLAFEIGRGPDGTWWVLGDRTQAPSGAGFALENRVATARVFSEHFTGAHVHRLAGFFRTFRDALQGLRADPAGRAAILTPGLLNDTYFEHAYIARYLGFMLLEGEDLTVQEGRVMVRTVGGLRPVDVLWRRLDAGFADPLELDGGSRIGTPGLVDAVRSGNVTLVNALGSGVLETRALLAFLPRIARSLLGADLLLPNIATWWCGQAAERAHVARHHARMMIGPALSTQLPFEADETTVLGAQFRKGAGDSIDAWLEADGPRLVGQEAVTLSTTPAYVDGALVPRPMSLRLFLVRGPEGWAVMPGGFARIGRTPDPAAIAMQRGGSAADLWVVSAGPVATPTLLPDARAPYARVEPGVLPSRAADNLFWLGRYVERAEGVTRLLRAGHVRLAEHGDPADPLIEALAAHLAHREIDVRADGVPEGLRRAIWRAIRSAGHVRDRFSTDGWMALNDLAKTMDRMDGAVEAGDDAARAMGVCLRKITGFSGLVHENMYRFDGWRFLSIGRALERALGMTGLLAAFAEPSMPEGALDLLVEVGDSVMTHRQRYAIATRRETVVDLLALDALNPRAVLCQLTEIRDLAALLPAATLNGQLSPLTRAILRVHTALAIQTPETLDGRALKALGREIERLSDRLSEAYLQ